MDSGPFPTPPRNIVTYSRRHNLRFQRQSDPCKPSGSVPNGETSTSNKKPVEVSKKRGNKGNKRLTKLQQALAQIEALEDILKTLQKTGVESHTCPICMELAWPPCVLRCGHTFCGPCLTTQCINHLENIRPSPDWRTMECGLCKKEIRHTPAVSYVLKDSVRGFAEMEGLTLSEAPKLKWPPSLPQ